MDQDISIAFTEADSDHEMESLMLCENDQVSDDDESSDGMQNIPTRHAKKIILSDSEEEENESISQEKVESDKEITVVASPKAPARKKISALVDSDSSELEINEINHGPISSGDEVRSTKSFGERPKKLLSSKERSKKAKKKSDDILVGLNLDFGSSSDSSDESNAGSAKSSKGSGSDNGELSGDEFVRKSAGNKGHPDGGKKQRVSDL